VRDEEHVAKLVKQAEKSYQVASTQHNNARNLVDELKRVLSNLS
jgi:hypothetical protein